MSTSLRSSPASHEYRAAYDATTDARAAIADADLLTPNVDLIAAAGTAVQALPGIHQLEQDMARILSKEELREVRRIETYALAMHFAQITYLTTIAPVEPIQDLAARATTARDVLSADATALVKRGLLDARYLEGLNHGSGFRITAVDCQILVKAFRANWHTIEGKTGLSAKELDATETLADDLASAVNLREQASSVTEAATKERARAFTLFSGAYDLARQAATFLRWKQEDTDSFVPSLYAGRGGRGKPTPATSPTKPATPATVSAPAAHTPAIPGNGTALPHVDPSLPGGNPFLS